MSSKKNKKFLQYHLLITALKEENIYKDDFLIDINHQKGKNFVNNIELPIIYPRSYLERINSIYENKKYNFCFIGYFDTKGRSEILEKFNNKNSLIINSDYGRSKNKKYQFDSKYFEAIKNSFYSLCPNHIGEWYKHEDAWTYRFIESLFCKTIPVCFKETPLGINFTQDFYFLNSDDVFSFTDHQYKDIVENNYRKAINKFTLSKLKFLL